VNPRFINWIWQIKGSLPLAPAQSSDDAFDRLDPFFRERGTSYERTHDTLVFRKENQQPQDKMSIFDRGTLHVEKGGGGAVLRYNLTSRALLYCFLAPLLFLAFAQLTIAVGELQKPSAEEAKEAKAKKDAEEEKDPAEKYASIPMNPIDKFLGAPAPEKPKKDKEKDKDKEKGPSPRPAYVFAAIFATLYVVGRILEDWLIKIRFRKRLLES